MTASALRFESVAMRRGNRTVVTAVDFVLRPGERWFLLGQNGSGKSTLLGAALGLLTTSAGRVTRVGGFAGRDAIGPVPQRANLHLALPTTVREFVGSGLTHAHGNRTARRRRIDTALSQVGLETVARRSFLALSEGQRQRTMIARALARDPVLLVLDEPTASLDPASARAVFDLFEAITADGRRAILCATHDLAAARRLSTAIGLLMRPGDDTLGQGRDRPSAFVTGSFEHLLADGRLARALDLPLLTATRSP
ncbi:MAG: ATP-binding cassette domain-containing protein [Planctomycetota bacterium]